MEPSAHMHVEQSIILIILLFKGKKIIFFSDAAVEFQ